MEDKVVTTSRDVDYVTGSLCYLMATHDYEKGKEGPLGGSQKIQLGCYSAIAASSRHMCICGALLLCVCSWGLHAVKLASQRVSLRIKVVLCKTKLYNVKSNRQASENLQTWQELHVS